MADPNTDSAYDFDWLDYLIGIGFILLFLVDVGTDIRMAAEYFMEEQWLFGSITTVPVFLAYLVACFFALANYHIIRVDLSADFVYISRYDEAAPVWVWTVRIIFLVFGLSPVVRTVEFLYCGYKSSCRECSEETRREYREHTLDIALANSFIRIFESYMEAAPQLCLQLYIIFKTIPDKPVAGGESS
ncbi:hypothetical protein BaRGS_00032053 [Batillaria attramentaria]|uniref:XK-related protein n=1 Tax=Batillaria attramentaria TaxID=370345 RepID=A0ABD0JPR3_9CAEN